MGLRNQLLIGLAIMMVVATVSVGAITVWATRHQLTEMQVTSGQILGQGLARLIAPAIKGRDAQDPQLQRLVSNIAAWNLVRDLRVKIDIGILYG